MEEKIIAFIPYTGITPLDLVGPLQVLTGVAASEPERGFTVAVVADSLDPVETDTPARILPTAVFEDVPSPYLVVVPGGDAALRAMADERLLDYLRSAAAQGAIVTSVCTGALVLGAAGLLEGRPATTHWAYTWMLPKLGARFVQERWIDDGSIVTAAGSLGRDRHGAASRRSAGRGGVRSEAAAQPGIRPGPAVREDRLERRRPGRTRVADKRGDQGGPRGRSRVGLPPHRVTGMSRGDRFPP
jgi:putative intracellular protease/amidase